MSHELHEKLGLRPPAPPYFNILERTLLRMLIIILVLLLETIYVAPAYTELCTIMVRQR